MEVDFDIYRYIYIHQKFVTEGKEEQISSGCHGGIYIYLIW